MIFKLTTPQGTQIDLLEDSEITFGINGTTYVVSLTKI